MVEFGLGWAPPTPRSYVVTGMLGISMSYHRQLSHKSFRCVKPLEYLLAYCGALAFEGDPIEWVSAWHWQCDMSGGEWGLSVCWRENRCGH